MSAELTFPARLRSSAAQHLDAEVGPDRAFWEHCYEESLLQGVGVILRLNQALAELGTAQNWNFVQIVITDGQDNSSKASLETTLATMLQVGRTIPVDRCKTIIIGIDLEQNREAAIELIAIRQMGIIRQVGIGVMEAGDERAVVMTQRDQLVAQVSQQSFAVIFNLDISGSMSGSRWTHVKSSVRTFLSQTPGTDLVAGICFNAM